MEMPRTRKAVLLLLAATAPTANSAHAATLESGLRYGFSECVDFKRTLYYYRDEEETCATGDSKKIIAKPPVHGLRCDLTCERGYFLGANFSGETPVSGCEKCDKGQYSLGGGKLYSKRTNAWSDPLPIDIHTDCVTRNMYTGQWQSNCAPWNASIDGAMISSGENSEIMERYEAARLFSTLRISATFVRDGSITYQFRVDAEAPYDGLVFEVDDTAVTPLISKTDGWNEASFEVAAGSHTFSWDYTKDYQGDEGEDKAFLKVIEIVGTSYSDTFCHPCGGDMTMSGGSICKFCKANEYAAAKSDSELDFTCYKCPEGMVSPKGSIGLDSCVEKRACTADDLVETFTECVDGKRNATFAWSEPRTCDLKLHNSIALPEAQINLSCNTCDLGYTLSEQDTCERCPPGQKLGETNECEQCPAGQVVVNALEFGTGTKDGWSKWPSIMDSVAAKRSGWKLTRHALSFTAHAKGEGEWSRPSRFPVPFNATFVHSGFINLTYELSHVPTFENDGVRAWLELEIRDTDAKSASKDETNTDAGSDDDDDDDNDDDEQLWGDLGGSIAHLAHGSENGTHSEIIHFNVTSRTTKQFTLVLRTTSPAAARMVRAKILHLGFVGTENGGSVTCGSCPAGYEAMSTDDGASADGCRVCPAGTFGKTDNNGVTTCEKCPVNTISAAGATECERCGNNTFSEAGAVSCAAPTTLTVDASPTNSSFVTANGATSVSYDLTLLESLVWGNDSFLFGDDMIAVRAKDQLSVAPVVPNGGIKIDTSHKVFVGLFRPVDKSWKSQLMGQIVEEHVDAARDFPYVIELTMLNPRDAGNFFIQNTGRYGQVECAAPAQWKASSGGSRMEIVPLSNGGGVQVHYTGGSICRNGQAASTEINFVCDPNAGTTVAPSATSRDEETCTTKITWSTAYACPICEAAYFNELRSACSSGQQSITYNNVQPCYGGKRPSSVPVATCNEVVLDTKAMYTVYAVISVVGIIVLLLMAAIFVTHRKYLTAYNEYMYLKGKMPTSVSTKEDGSKETTFEFANNSNTAHASPVPGRDDETKEEEDEGIEMNVRSV
ncbi:Proteins containing ca2-binding domain, partial [Globisporangium splendens]